MHISSRMKREETFGTGFFRFAARLAGFDPPDTL